MDCKTTCLFRKDAVTELVAIVVFEILMTFKLRNNQN